MDRGAWRAAAHGVAESDTTKHAGSHSIPPDKFQPLPQRFPSGECEIRCTKGTPNSRPQTGLYASAGGKGQKYASIKGDCHFMRSQRGSDTSTFRHWERGHPVPLAETEQAWPQWPVLGLQWDHRPHPPAWPICAGRGASLQKSLPLT